jgi:hypothetical protein
VISALTPLLSQVVAVNLVTHKDVKNAAVELVEGFGQ